MLLLEVGSRGGGVAPRCPGVTGCGGVRRRRPTKAARGGRGAVGRRNVQGRPGVFVRMETYVWLGTALRCSSPHKNPRYHKKPARSREPTVSGPCEVTPLWCGGNDWAHPGGHGRAGRREGSEPGDTRAPRARGDSRHPPCLVCRSAEDRRTHMPALLGPGDGTLAGSSTRRSRRYRRLHSPR